MSAKSDKTGAKTAAKIRAKSQKAKKQTTLKRTKLPAGAMFGEGELPEGSISDAAGFGVQGAQAEQFPSEGYTVDDPRDEKYQMMLELQEDGQPGMTPFGQIQYSDDVLSWMQKKRDADVKHGFEQWFATNFDLMSPAHKALARKMYPNFYKERMSTLKNNTKLLGDLARIKLMGIQSRDDLFLQYAVDSGMIDLTNIMSILNPRGPYPNEVEFKRGLLNPRVRHPANDGPLDDMYAVNKQFMHAGNGFRTTSAYTGNVNSATRSRELWPYPE